MQPDSVSRRLAVVGIGGLALAAAMPSATLAQPTQQRRTPVFVLVHGAWHGGWCWKKVRPLLERQGYQVYTPTLTGLGERAHLLSESIDLDTHVQDIVNVLEYEDLSNVVLVGHSYAGMVITGVADRAASRIRQLVYLDAFFPENGKALSDYTRRPPATTTPPPAAPARTPADWRVPPRSTPEEFGVRAPEDIAWVRARLGPQSARTFGQPVHLSGPIAAHIARAYVLLTEDSPWFIEASERAQREGLAHRKLLGGGHDAMISEPDKVAAVLAELAGN